MPLLGEDPDAGCLMPESVEHKPPPKAARSRATCDDGKKSKDGNLLGQDKSEGWRFA
jgi:hypothetical protein